MLILLRSFTNEHQFFAEKHIFPKNITQFSDSMTYSPLPDHTAYSIRANVISVEILITQKIQPRHKWARRWSLSKLAGLRILRRGIWL